ncbi:MAG: HAMP domain-containing sensor histidine kinase [Acidobacteriota bacterium]
MFRKAGTRIAATGALVTLAALALFATVARVATERIMTADLDDELETLSIAMASDLETRGAGELPHESLRKGVESNILAYRLEHHSAVLFDATRILGTTGDLARRTRFAELASFATRPETPFTAAEPFTGHVRLCRFRVVHLGQRAAGLTLVVFRSVEGVERTLGTLDAALTLLVLAGGAASAIILLIAIRRALDPVERITRFAGSVTARDLSQRVHVVAAGQEFRHLADVVNSLLERLAGSFDAQRRLVSDAAHELKTPAAVIAAEAQELGRGTLSDTERKESLQVIGRAAAGLAHEVDDLLELARGDASAPREHESFEIDEAIEEAVALSGAAARERDVKIVFGERARCVVRGDHTAIVRAIGNLVSNAARYGPRGGQVEVTARHRADGGCEIDVADRGPGVPEGERRRIFERFVRLAPARRAHPEGSGLGLAIVDQVVRAHGGGVDVLEREGGGSVFRMRLS